MNQPTQAPRRKHLMDPNAPRPAPNPEELKHLKRVQRIVTSALVFTTILHLSIGLIVAADHVDQDRTDARVVLLALGTTCWLLGVLAVRGIQQRSLMTPWLVTTVLPATFGIWWVFYR